MRRDGHGAAVGLCGAGLQGRDEVHVTPDEAEQRKHAAGARHFLLHATQGLQQDVHSLVVELVAAGDRQDLRVGGQRPAQERRRRGKDLLAGFPRRAARLGQVGDACHVEAVGRDHLGGAAEEILCLEGRDVAHRREAVGLACTGRLQGILGGAVVGAGLALGRDVGHLGVDVHARGGQRPAQDGRVKRENRPDLGDRLLHEEQPRPAHHIVELGDGLEPLRLHLEVVDRLDDLAAGVAEHDPLDVVPAARNGVDPVILPELEQELILVELLREVHQDDPRLARDLPAAEAAGQVLDGRVFPDGRPEILLGLLELEVVLQVRPQQDVSVPEGTGRAGDLAADGRVNLAHLVADFPAHFEKIIVALGTHGRTPVFPAILPEKSFRMFI